MPSRSKFPVNSVKILNGAVWKCPDKFFCRSKSRPMPSELSFTACLHGGGGPQIGEVTYGGSPYLSCTRDQIKGLFTWRWGTPGRWGNLLRWGNPLSILSLTFIWWRLHDRLGDHMRDYMNRRFTPPKLVTSLTWGPPPPCKQALKWEIMWTGGLPHPSGSPHLPGIPHLHVNRPLDSLT